MHELVPLLMRSLISALDRHQLLGSVEALDALVEAYVPALYCSSAMCDELLGVSVALLRHPHMVASDMYAHDLLMRLCGNVLCSCSWLNMRRVDNMVRALSGAGGGPLDETGQRRLLETLSATLKPPTKQQQQQQQQHHASTTQAEMITGLSVYSYALTFNNAELRAATDQLFVHSMRMLCLLACVIEESALPSALTTPNSAQVFTHISIWQYIIIKGPKKRSFEILHCLRWERNS